MLFRSQQLLNFQSCFLFPEASFWDSLTSFSKLSFGEISLWTIIEIWLLLVPLRATFLAEILAKSFPLALRESSLECPGMLITAEVADKGITSNF